MTDTWATGTLAQFTEISRHRTDPRLLGDQPLVHYSIPVLDETGLPAVESAATIASHKFTVPRDAVLVSLLNPRIPRVWKAIGAPHAVCSTEFAVLTPFTASLETDFLHLLCQSESFWEELQKRAVGTTGSRQRAKAEGLLSIAVAIPPLSVQRRIVDLMAHLDDHIANLRSEHSSLRMARDAVLGDVLMGKMGSTSSPSGDWRQATLGESAALVIGKTPPRKEPRYWTDDLTYPFCTIADMVGTRIDPTREGVTPDAIAEGKAKLVPAGSLLMSFKLTIGRIGFASRDLYPNEAIVWIRSTDPDLDERFLALWLSNQDLSSGSGRAVKGETLNGDSLRAIKVAIPPLPLQQEVVNLMADLDSHLVSLEGEIGALQMMRSDLLEGLLTRSVEIPGSYDHLLSEVA